MASHGFKPISPALPKNPYEVLAELRPTKPNKNLGEAITSHFTHLASPLNKVIGLFRQSQESSTRALELLNDVNRPFSEIKEDVFRLIQASTQSRKTAYEKSTKLDEESEIHLVDSAKWLIPNAKRSLLIIPDYLDEDRILGAAEDLNDLHRDNLSLGESSMPILQSYKIKEQYPNLARRLDEIRSTKQNKKTLEIQEFLEGRTEAFRNEASVLKADQEYAYHFSTEQIARASLFSGIPHDLAIDLMTEYFDLYGRNVFRKIPILDSNDDSAKVNSIEDLKPSFNLLGYDVPLQTMDFVRHAAMQNVERFNMDGSESSFITSLRNLDEIQHLYQELNKIDVFEREPHRFGLGAWSELRTGFALIKLQEQQEAKYLSNMADVDKVPYVITKIIPVATKPYYDKAGIDFWVKVVDRLDFGQNYYIPLQVKSSELGINNYKESNFKHAVVNVLKGGNGRKKGLKSISTLVNDLQAALRNPSKVFSEEKFKAYQNAFEEAQQKKDQNHPDSDTRKLIRRLRSFLRK
jgi:hypothetical protein